MLDRVLAATIAAILAATVAASASRVLDFVKEHVVKAYEIDTIADILDYDTAMYFPFYDLY